MGEEEHNIKDVAFEQNVGSRKVPAERISASLSDLKLSHDKQIPWGTLYGELSKSHKAMEFAWKDATIILFMSTVHNSK
jgi:hypothetical protein